MSLNRHSSSRRKLNQGKSRRRKSSQSTVNYQSLEERRLLAVDVGLNFTGSTFGRSLSPPNVTGGVGPNHVVQVIDNQFQVFEKTTGAVLVDKALDTFWTDTGGAGAQSSPEMIQNTSNARVVYDADTRRWFISAVSTADIITGAIGVQSPTLVAVSRTSDPTQDWQSLTNFYDVDADPVTPPIQYEGGFLSAGAGAITTNLSVDDHNLYVSVGEASPFVPPQTWAFNKFADLVVPTPNSLNPSAWFVDATTIQWGTDVTGTAVGTFGLVVPASGSSVLLEQITDADIAGGAILQNSVSVAVDAYEAPPQYIRQEFDPDLVNSGAGLTSATKRLGNSLWAVHSILGSGNGQNPDGGVVETSALRWYEIDLDTKTVKQSGTIEHDFFNYIFPSIAVTPEGHVAISFTATGVGPTPGSGLFPTLMVAVGYSNNGTMIMEEPVSLKDGEGGYFDGSGNFWGRYGDTVADPNDPAKVWVFGEWSDDSDDGQTQVVEVSLIGLSPKLEATTGDNVIVVRRSELDNTQIEVEIDGTVVETYQESILYSIQVDGMGGDDTFVVDTANGELEFPGGVNFVGDGNDQVDLRTLLDTNWEIALGGKGTAAIGSDFPASCDVVHQDLVTFNLNFEEGSLWFDATAYTSQYGTTFGDALRGELQNYFDTVIAPIFAGTFTMTLDINDDEVDTFASATALGYSFHEVNGQNIWAASPWSILTGRGDTNGSGTSDGVIDYNLDLDLYQGDQQALLDNIAGGLTRNQFFRVLGMESFIPNETQTFDPRGNREVASVMDTLYRDVNDAPLVGNYSGADFMFDVLNYVANPNWAGDNSGIYFLGIDDSGAEMRLAVNSNTELIDFDTLASSLAGTSRDGDFNEIVEQDRAFLRGLGYVLNPITVPTLGDGFKVTFSGLDEIQAGDGVDNFCIRSSNVDLQISGGIGNDIFNVTGLGVGAINLFGESGDDTYTVVFSPAGVITIGDSVGSENDTLIGLGTSSADNFVFDVNGIKVNAGLLVYVGIENTSFDGLEGDDIFEVKAAYPGISGLNGGDGVDTFIVDASGSGDTLTISVDDPATDPVNRLRLDLSSVVTDTYIADEIENFQVDGTFVIDGVNGAPTVTGGLNLLGDGNEIIRMESMSNATWVVDGNGAGNVRLGLSDPILFTGVRQIDASHGFDLFNIRDTDTNLLIHAREGDDSIRIDNAGIGIVTVNGNTGRDRFTVTDSGGGVNLSGNEGNDTFTINDGGSGSALLYGDDGNDVFEIQFSRNSIAMQGGEGNDRFTVSLGALGEVRADGQEGSDVYQFAVGSQNNRKMFALDTGVVGSDRIVTSLSDFHDTLNLSDERVTVQTDILRFNENFESLVINARRGNDIININRSIIGYLRILGAEGDDDINIQDSAGINSILIDAGVGFDEIRVDSTPVGSALTAYGGSGEDSFFVSQRAYGNAVIDGQEDADRYDVFFAGLSPRYVVARDSGLVGKDHLTVRGSASSDVMEFRSGVVRTPNQDILYTQSTETMSLLTEGGNDMVTVYGVSSPQTTIMGQAGSDLIHLISTFGPATSKIVNVDGGDGNDNILVSGSNADTMTNVFGSGGDDNLTFGSFFADNNGNLNHLYGEVFASGGNGNDRIYINDAGNISSFDYEVGSNFVRSSSSSYFAGITFDNSSEILRLDATNYKNNLLVTPNFNTKFSFFGNGGLNKISLTGDPADDGRQFYGQNGGDGIWTFTNGARDIYFSNFLLG